MQIKYNKVVIQGLSTELLLGLMILDSVFVENDCVADISCMLEGKHSYTSLHYSGNAADLSTAKIPEEKREVILKEGKKRLGGKFDFILEADHYHLEYQPKR